MVQERREQQNGQPILLPEIAAGIEQAQENIPPQVVNQVQIFEVFADQPRPGKHDTYCNKNHPSTSPFLNVSGLLNIPQPNIGLNLVALANKKNKSVIEINKRRISELSAQETEYYSLHTQRESHNQTSSSSK